MRIDLHTHSHYSDGTQSPARLVEAAAEAELDGLALTDHDTCAGWPEAQAAAEAAGIRFVPGTEISCAGPDERSIHLLSYWHDPHDSALTSMITQACDTRLLRARTIVERISEDYPLTWEDVLGQIAPGATVGRPHIADALVRAGIVQVRDEAFVHILAENGPYYVAQCAPTPVQAIEVVVSAGGVPVLAHPATARNPVPRELYEPMIQAGLVGLEVAHRDNTAQGVAFLEELAAHHGLIMTGSSDYHGSGKANRLGENVTSGQALEWLAARRSRRS